MPVCRQYVNTVVIILQTLKHPVLLLLNLKYFYFCAGIMVSLQIFFTVELLG